MVIIRFHFGDDMGSGVFAAQPVLLRTVESDARTIQAWHLVHFDNITSGYSAHLTEEGVVPCIDTNE